MRVCLLLCLVTATSTAVCRSYVIQPGIWKYRNHPIAYEQARSISEDETATEKDPTTDLASAHSTVLLGSNEDKPPLLLLNGFGVGSFHQHRLIQKLFSSHENRHRTVYCVDYLGQGRSWPEDCQDGCSENEIGLRYCGETWVDQIIAFLDQVVLPQHPGHRRVHIAGNSVGGHLAVFVAAKRLDLVESLCLLNATPLWGLNLPGWSGHLPAPWLPKLVGRYFFDRIRDLNTIEQYLSNAYANAMAFDRTLMQQIRECTEGNGGHAAFASIMWSPPISIPLGNSDDGTKAYFYDCLRTLQCDVLLLFGRDDPWCKPIFAKRMLLNLKQRNGSAVERYAELSQVGHCPNHEAPSAVARILTTWMDAAAGRSRESLRLPTRESVPEIWGETTIEEREEMEIPLSLVDRLTMVLV